MEETTELVILCRAGLAEALKQIVAEQGSEVITLHDRKSLLDCSLSGRVLISFSTSVIVPPKILNSLSCAFNFHPGPPSHPGRDPHYWAVYDGTQEFGCTAHIMEERVDEGAIVATRLFDISNVTSPEELRAKTEIVMLGFFEELLPQLLANSIKPKDQQWSGQKKSRADFLIAGHRFEANEKLTLPPLEPYDLGNAHQFGIHTAKNRKAAISAFSQAAIQGDSRAQVRMARYCIEENETDRALTWLERAQANSSPAADLLLDTLNIADGADFSAAQSSPQSTKKNFHKHSPRTPSIRYPLAKPYFSDRSLRTISEQIESILSSGRLMLGPYSKKLEQAFAAYVGTPHSVSLNSGTTALTVALKFYGVDGGEVLVPSGAFVTDVSAVLFAGANPVLVDMNPITLSFDLDDLERKVTNRTKAIIWVHLTGVITPEYKKIQDLATRYNLPLIEDAAQAHGSRAQGKTAGSFGDAGCFSFYPTKIMTCGSGGMLTTRDSDLKRFAEEMRIFGKDNETGSVKMLGNDWFLDEIRCCIAYNQLLDLPEMVARRRELAAYYRSNLSNVSGLQLLNEPDDFKPSYYQFVCFLDQSIDGQTLNLNLRQKYGIETKQIYKPTHEEEVFTSFDTGDLGRATETLNRSLCLPMHSGMLQRDVDFVSQCLLTEMKKLQNCASS